MLTISDAAGQELLPQRPQFGCQVLVQSEEERMLRKQVRKEEKKIHKILGKVEAEDEADDFRFDPVDLRTKRQAALANAMSQPILKEKAEATARHYQQQEVYPFVFDGMAKSKTAAGFVQGMKIALPIGFERHDQKNFEEVMIPASENAPVEIGRNLIPIDSLDEIGQAAFNGMKSLNRIQSVVCDAAYRTNENLLVCAPTGAGKTNVAMLCIVQTIKQNILNGVIKKDQFKIVYVAPMKALASEMTASFGKRLAPLGIKVKELTGDMKLTKTEIQATQMLVTTPEKWDVVTRKPGDVSLAQLVRLLIIDEVHLLHGDRGPVVESLVARTLRLVESSQTVIRIVGLSATLPNYIDVAGFLRVNPYRGLFFFDARFRPVPLAQTFIGVKETRPMAQRNQMDEVCYEKVVKFLRMGKQIMVFVHARNATAKTGMILKEMAQNKGTAAIFEPEEGPQLGLAKSAVQKSRNRQLQELFNSGIGMHHAGMLRSDRNLVEKLFAQGHIKVLCCTATLAWGVNLPAHAVIIKGTEIYDAKRGSFVDIGILDVLQIFGRAGRPQFDKSGHGTIITSHDKLSHYLSLLTNQFPIESNFIHFLADNLNAEISLGTVTNLDEAVTWLSYTYLHVRMRKNPLVYGISYAEVRDDPALLGKRREIVIDAARKLDKNKMIRFDERTGYLHACDLGRTASQFYIKHDTIEVFNEMMKPVMKEDEILDMLSRAQEFEQLKVRDDELDELDDMTHDNCEVRVSGGAENVHGKVNILLQTHISRGRVNSFSLISDQHYVVQNATRIARALFEIVLRKNWPLLAGRILKFTKTIERQMWDFETPLKQHPNVKYEILDRLEKRNFTLDKLREMDSTDIGHMINHVRAGADVKKAAMEIPLVELEATIQPITRTVLRVRLTVTANFRWNDRVHGGTEPFWIWVEDPENNHIYHHEYFLLSKKQVNNHEKQEIVFTIPIFEPLPSQYYIRAISDRWIGSETYCAISFQHLILPERHPPHTDLLDLQPLPISALNNSSFEALYNFSHFNPIQTQIFHTLYHTDKNFLLGAPTGSGKTIAAEIAMFKVFRDYPDAKVVYIAPMKALVRERMGDWKNRFEREKPNKLLLSKCMAFMFFCFSAGQLGKKCVELTGDVTPDQNAIKNSSVIVTTPEKWDGISRSW
jgi:activating signal cointegrator complex subunit 3